MTTSPAQRLRVLPGVFTVGQAPRDADVADGWVALVRAPEGLTVVREVSADEEDPGEEGWMAFYGGDSAHDLDVPGMLAAVVGPLALAEIPVFVASTFHADLVLVPRERVAAAASALRAAGHQVDRPS